MCSIASLPPFHALRVHWVRFRPCFCAIVDTGMMTMMMPSFQPLRMPFKSLLYLAMQTNTPARCRRCSSSRLYSRSSSVRHACPARGERTKDALVDIPIANVLAKPAVSWLIHCHWELDANTHDRIRPAPRRASWICSSRERGSGLPHICLRVSLHRSTARSSPEDTTAAVS